VSRRLTDSWFRSGVTCCAYPATAAHAIGLMMAFQRKKPAAIGIKAAFPGFSATLDSINDQCCDAAGGSNPFQSPC